MLRLHNSIYHREVLYPANGHKLPIPAAISRPSESQAVRINLANFNQTMRQINNGHSGAVAEEMLRQLDALKPELESKRLAYMRTQELRRTTFDKPGEGQGIIALDNGIKMRFVIGKEPGGTESISYYPETPRLDDPRMPFGYINIKNNSVTHATMWTPASQCLAPEKYHSMSITKLTNGQYAIDTQFTFNNGQNEDRLSLERAQKILATNANGILSREIAQTLHTIAV